MVLNNITSNKTRKFDSGNFLRYLPREHSHNNQIPVFTTLHSWRDLHGDQV